MQTLRPHPNLLSQPPHSYKIPISHEDAYPRETPRLPLPGRAQKVSWRASVPGVPSPLCKEGDLDLEVGQGLLGSERSRWDDPSSRDEGHS